MRFSQSSLQTFQREMEQVEGLVHVLLKGHVLIEEVLTRIIEQYPFHPEHLRDARLIQSENATRLIALPTYKDQGLWRGFFEAFVLLTLCASTMA
jgi:hypothetical protein